MSVHVAELNIGTMRAPTDDPSVAEFMDNLDRINADADRAPGFVWRLQTDDGNATDIQIFPNPLILVNMSVWRSLDDLKTYVYRTAHVDFLRRRAEWFETDAKRVVLWHVATHQIPQLDEAVRRLEFLERHGPSPYAFDFARPPAPLVFEASDLDDSRTLDLMSRSNRELADVSTEPNETQVDLTTDEVTGDCSHMVRVRQDGELVGCGAIRRIEPGVGEIERMFVEPAARRSKIGAAIVDQLELAAARSGITELRLQTGPHQVEANGLYPMLGYERCDAWGQYLASSATSRCYRKRVDGPPSI